MSDTRKFHIQINGGHEQTIEVRTGEYTLAALASLAFFDYEKHDEYDVVKIWVPDLVTSGYGPYFVAWDGMNIGIPYESRKW